MVSAVVELAAADHAAVLAHLLPVEPEAEEAAFLFATSAVDAGRLQLRVIEKYFVKPEEFNIRTLGHLELRADVHERMIRTAHYMNAVLIETHSHPYDFESAACFSPSDLAGLAQVVPHVMFRLPQRPYAAIVVAPAGFDALIWTEPGGRARTIDAVLVGGKRMLPTGYTSSRGWRTHGPV